MRAVALADSDIQAKVEEKFVPLKISMEPGDDALPLDWPALQKWARSYSMMGSENVEGFTFCTVVSSDLETEYGGTGSAFVWELFDSVAYDAAKFSIMLDDALARAEREETILSNTSLTEVQRQRQLRFLRLRTKREVQRESRFQLPPQGFTVEGAKRLFELSGDLKKK